jgi:hypothetical protein
MIASHPTHPFPNDTTTTKTTVHQGWLHGAVRDSGTSMLCEVGPVVVVSILLGCGVALVSYTLPVFGTLFQHYRLPSVEL